LSFRSLSASAIKVLFSAAYFAALALPPSGAAFWARFSIRFSSLMLPNRCAAQLGDEFHYHDLLDSERDPDKCRFEIASRKRSFRVVEASRCEFRKLANILVFVLSENCCETSAKLDDSRVGVR
jgi:hypothetical protein